MSSKITYLGSMAFLLQRSDGMRILCDPYLSKSDFTSHKPCDFYDVDWILISHAAFDHIGDAFEILQNGNAHVICGPEVKRMILRECPCVAPERIHSVDYGERIVIDERTSARATLAFHPSNAVENDIRICYQPFGFVIFLEEGVRFYHTGDTSLFSDMKLIRDLYHPNIMNVGISRFSPAYGIQMTPQEAAIAVEWISPELVFPSHYPKGDDDLPLFLEQVRVRAPHVCVKVEADETIVYTPARIEAL